MAGCYCNDETCIHNMDGQVCEIRPSLEVKDVGVGAYVVCTDYKDGREDD